jgi:DNA-binding NarL/FixJ family response regulator
MANETERPRAKVLLVDDHPLLREHLAALIEQEPDLEVCGEAEDGPTALSLVSRHEPDLVILDVSLKRSSGFDLLKDLKELQPEAAVLVLSMHHETLYAERALRAGAMGYVTKEEAPANVLVAVRRVLAGQRYVSQHTAMRMKRQPANGGGGELDLPLAILPEAGGMPCGEKVQP